MTTAFAQLSRPPKNGARSTPRRLAAACLLASLSTAGGVLAADPPASEAAERPAAKSEDDFDQQARELFDEHSLAGWEGKTYWFRVEGDAIVAGRLDEKIPHNEFLCTTEKFDDFELRLEVKLIGEGNNAGVQFRSRRVPDSSEVSGYQADVGAAWDRPVWGALYDESRRKRMLAEPEPEKVKEVVKADDWNELRIRCQGPRIEIFLNGTQTVDYVESDESIPRSGVIGLQIHSGPPTEAWYRNIRLRSL